LLPADGPVYLVGGAVRDAYLGIPPGDLDFVVAQGGVQLAFHVADRMGRPAYVLDRERDVGRVVLADGRTTLDFARMRGGDINADLRERDFTVNAMALLVGKRSTTGIIDPCGGQRDLNAGLLRQVQEHAIADDPVRALRAVRMALRFDLRLTDETSAAVRAAGDSLGGVSVERIHEELLKLLMVAAPHQGLRQLRQLGLLERVLPEVAATVEIAQSPPHHLDVFNHTCEVLRRQAQLEAIIFDERPADEPLLAQAVSALSPYQAGMQEHLQRAIDGKLTGRMTLRLGALFHDVGKPETRTVDADGRVRFFGHEAAGARLAGHRLQQLHLSSEACRTVKQIVAGHMRPLHLAADRTVTRRAVYRYFRNTGVTGPDIALLSLADCLGTYEAPAESATWPVLLDTVGHLLNRYFNHYEESVRPPPLISGSELISALGLSPGPEVGRLLALIQEAQAVGEVITAEEALQLARRASQDVAPAS